MHALGRLEHLAQVTIDAISNVRRIAVRLDMDVARPGPKRSQDRKVDEVDDRAPLDHLVKVGHGAFVDRFHLGNVDVAFLHRREEGIHVHVFRQVLALVFLQVVLRHQHRTHGASRERPQTVLHGQRLRLDHRDGQFTAHAK